MKSAALFLLALGVLAAQPTNLVVTPGTTSITFEYDAPTSTACTWEMSESNTFAPVVIDLNTTLFPGSNSDLRTIDPNPLQYGRHRMMFTGTPRAEVAADGTIQSRAIAAYTRYYYRGTCNGSAVTGSISTNNIALGSAFPSGVDYLSGAFGNVMAPTIDFTDQSKIYIDHNTGLKMMRVDGTGSNQWTSAAIFTPSTPRDTAAAWTNPANAIDPTLFADVTSTGSANALFIPVWGGDFVNVAGFGVTTAFTDFQFALKAYGDNTGSILSGCLSVDGGQTCHSNTIDFTTLTASPATVTFPPSSYPGATPFNQWYSVGASYPSTPLNIMFRSGTATCSGTAVTWTGGNHQFALTTQGDYFNDLTVGQHVTINGVDKSIVSVTDALHLTVNSACASGAFSIYPFGLRLWKKSGTGAVHVNTTRFGYVQDEIATMPDLGEMPLCSQVLVSGGYACVFPGRDSGNISNTLWHINKTTGASKFISRIRCVPGCTGNLFPVDDGPNGSAMLSVTPDPNDPTIWWALTTTNSATALALYKITYSGSWTNYAAPADNQNVDNPSITYANVTKKSVSLDLFSQASVIYGLQGGDASKLTIGNFGNCKFWSIQGHYGIVDCRHGADQLGVYFLFNTLTNLVERVWDTWSVFPNRWATSHTPPFVYGPDYAITFQNPSNNWIVNITAVTGNAAADTSLGINQVTDCAPYSIQEPWKTRFDANGVVCQEIKIDAGDVRLLTAGAGVWLFDQWPHPDQATYPNYSQLQTIAVGDQIYDAATSGSNSEHMIVVKKTATSGGWLLVLRRGYQVIASAVGRAAHSSGWTSGVLDAYYAGSVNKWLRFSTGTVTNDVPTVAGAHFDVWVDGVINGGTISMVGSLVRAGLFSAQIGLGPDRISDRQYQPKFADSPATSGIYNWRQAHPSAQHHGADANERKAVFDGHPWGGTVGGSNSLWYHQITTCATINTCTASNAATAGVYKVGIATDSGGSVQVSVDPKKLPFSVWAGRSVLWDKSGPGSVLGAADTWMYCYAYLAGECQTGSTAGDMYMNVPQMYATGLSPTRNNCLSSMDLNIPCWTPGIPDVPWMRQWGIDHDDPLGIYVRKLTTFWSGHGWTDNFIQPRPFPDSSAMLGIMPWANGIRTAMMLAFLPPWPAEDSLRRNTFLLPSITVGGTTGDSVRVRFGYVENDQGQLPANVPNCMTRNDGCYTNGSTVSYDWGSDTPTWTSCGTGCTLPLPVVPGRRVLFQIVRKNGAQVTAGPIRVMQN